MKRIFFIISCLLFSVSLAFAAPGIGTTPLLETILLNSPTANTTLDSILSQQGSTPLLDNIINQASGTPVRTIPATQTAPTQWQGLTSSNGWQVLGGILTATGWAMTKWQPTVGAAAIGLGYIAKYEFDLKKAYDNSWFHNDATLKPVVDSAFPSAEFPSSGDVLSIQGSNFSVSGSWSYQGYLPQSVFDQTPGTFSLGPKLRSNNQRTQLQRLGAELGSGYFALYIINITPSTAPVTFPATGPQPGSALTPQQLTDLANKFATAIANDPLVRQALETMVNQHPELINRPYPISNQDVNNYKNNNITAALNQASTTISNISNANPTDTAAATASANASANVTINENKETFDKVPAKAFATPYAKDEVNFTNRLNTFFTNVKSSPLFSFSQGFFNSIPVVALLCSTSQPAPMVIIIMT